LIILIQPPPLYSYYFPIGIRAGPSKEALSLGGRSIIMSNYERAVSIRPLIFDGTNFIYWKVRVTAYLQSLGTEVWDIIDTGYSFPLATPTDPAEKKKYETNAKAFNTLLGCPSQSEFVKVMQYKSAK